MVETFLIITIILILILISYLFYDLSIRLETIDKLNQQVIQLQNEQKILLEKIDIITNNSSDVSSFIEGGNAFYGFVCMCLILGLIIIYFNIPHNSDEAAGIVLERTYDMNFNQTKIVCEFIKTSSTQVSSSLNKNSDTLIDLLKSLDNINLRLVDIELSIIKLNSSVISTMADGNIDVLQNVLS